MDKVRRLQAEEIDVRVGSRSKDKTKANLLFYKDARVDMGLLDEMFGVGGWQCDYREIKGVMYCGIGVKFGNEWVWKWNAGVESKGTGEDDSNNQKGEASDAFKRAGFLWGIGRELYEIKDVWVDTDPSDNYPKFTVSEIEFDDYGKPKKIVVLNKKGETAYKFPKGRQSTAQAPTSEVKPEPHKDTEKPQNAPHEPLNAPKPQSTPQPSNVDAEKLVNDENKLIGGEMMKIAKDVVSLHTTFTAEAQKRLFTTSIQKYLTEVLKFPVVDGKVAKIELAKNARQPHVKGNTVVVFDDLFQQAFAKFVEDQCQMEELPY